MNRPDPSRLLGERGTSLVFALLVLFGLLSLTVAALHSSTFDLKTSNNYFTSAQALLAAESGLLHAQKVINDPGVIAFDRDVVTPWSTLFGTASRAIPGYSSVQYSVTAAADATDPARFALLTSTGTAPNQSQRQVQARLKLGGVFSPGAIYLLNQAALATFNGNAFLVDGNDHNIDGSLPSPPNVAPGIATVTQADATSVENSLSGGQYDNVIGAGNDPSVEMAAGPSAANLTSDIIPRILAQPGVVTNPHLNGNDLFGTIAVPQITHFTGSVSITGSMVGVGILIVDQGLTISGNVRFTGLVLVRGTTDITAVQGNTSILGSIWTTDLQLRVSGSASVTYSSQALGFVDQAAPTPVLPRHVKVASWNEL